MNKSASAVKQLKRGESIILMQGRMVCVTWKDSRVVNLISNLPGPLSLEVDVQRREKMDQESSPSRNQLLSTPTILIWGVLICPTSVLVHIGGT